jgi:hypothetical protein
MDNLWSTPFLKLESDEVVRERFINHILQEYDIFNPPTDYNKINILDDKSDAVVKFTEQVIKPSFEKFLNESLGLSLSDWTGYRFNGWLTGSGENYSMTHHNHAGSQISAVFYLLADDIDQGGAIYFTDPRQNANRGYDAKFSKWFAPLELKPKSGDVVIFPSYLYHFVETYQSNLRLALPVDCFLFADS